VLSIFLLAKRIPIYPTFTATSSLVATPLWGTKEHEKHLPERSAPRATKHKVVRADRAAPRQKLIRASSHNTDPVPNGHRRGPTHRPAQSPWPATPAHRPSA